MAKEICWLYIVGYSLSSQDMHLKIQLCVVLLSKSLQEISDRVLFAVVYNNLLS